MRLNKDSWLFNVNIAHRGLWGDLPENSLPAYHLAVKKGYAIETDVFETTDGELVCFHDDNLKRATGVDGAIWDYSYTELSKLKLFNSEEKIPKLSELLSITEKKVPLLIEIKNQPQKKIVNHVLDALKNYKGEFAIQSFNPLYILKVKKLAPKVIRGVLGSGGEKVGFIKNFIIKKMPLNFLLKPDFISYNKDCYPLPIRTVKDKVKLAWTVTSKKEYEKVKPYVDNIIFEGFIPDNKD